MFGVVLAMTAEGFSYAEAKEIADQVRDELLRIEEVAKVEIYGAQDERIFVEYNTARLAELGLSVGQLMQLLRTRNIIIPGGDVLAGSERIHLEPTGNFASLDDLRRTRDQAAQQPRGGLPRGRRRDLPRLHRPAAGDGARQRRARAGHRRLACARAATSSSSGEDVAAVIDRLQQRYPDRRRVRR